MNGNTGCVEVTPAERRRMLRKRRGEAVRFCFRLLWARTGYRPWARLLHRLNLHHAKRHTMLDGTVITKCEWCGLSAVEYSDARRRELGIPVLNR